MTRSQEFATDCAGWRYNPACVPEFGNKLNGK